VKNPLAHLVMKQSIAALLSETSPPTPNRRVACGSAAHHCKPLSTTKSYHLSAM